MSLLQIIRKLFTGRALAADDWVLSSAYPSYALHGIGGLLRSSHLLIRTRLWAQIITGMVAGILLGMALSPDVFALVSPRTAASIAEWLSLPGGVFLGLIQMVMIPLVVTSIILGIASGGDADVLKRLGLRVVPFFLITTLLAVVIGIGTAGIIQPGSFVDEGLIHHAEQLKRDRPPSLSDAPSAEMKRSLPSQITSLLPTNPLQSAVERSMLDLVVVALFLGIAMVGLPREQAKPLADLANSVLAVSMRVVSWAMLLAPWAVFGMIGQLVMTTGLPVLLSMLVYIATVLAGLLLLQLVYLLIIALLARRHPLRFLRQIGEAMLLAFSTSSSAATMPLSMRIAEERLHVDPSISRFVIPLGATVNMAGTALYQVCAVLFLTQVFDVSLDTSQLVLVAMTAIGASIGAPSTPGVGIVILATILGNVGIPPSGIALIIGVDRLLDMARTTVNVTGDLVATVLVDRWMEEPEPIVEQSAEGRAL